MWILPSNTSVADFPLLNFGSSCRKVECAGIYLRKVKAFVSDDSPVERFPVVRTVVLASCHE